MTVAAVARMAAVRSMTAMATTHGVRSMSSM
jgi:hypothetical protein